ncbi:MAG: tetraacyldisaccharide 4'-kinase [Deltaproteobacteria bacterium]|nr:tetraacyldisaccharide 4'-kinase [Deltaproteobacteria bacterium]
MSDLPAHYDRKNPSTLERLAWLPIDAIGLAYAAIMRARAAMYDAGFLRSIDPPIPAINVGNLTLGGTGKTPLTLEVARILAEMGRRPGIVSRGYRARREGEIAIISDGSRLLLDANEAGDEPVMMAHRDPRIPVVIGARRPEAVARVAALGADVAVCDDAFQHLRLRRRLDVVAIQGAAGFGNGRVFPAGPLREPMSALARAHVIAENVGDRESDHERVVRDAGFRGDFLRWSYRVVELRRLSDDAEVTIETLRGASVHAVAATARPESFAQTLESLGARVVHRTYRRDHHRWTRADLDEARRIAATGGVPYHIATEKDAVKLRGVDGIDEIPFFVLMVDVRWHDDGEERLRRRLVECLR